MALVRLPSPLFCQPVGNFTTAVSLVTPGEKAGIVGYVQLEGGPGTKTMSSAGGAITWPAFTTLVFTDPGSTYRIGVQDVTSGGVEDGTYDVYGTLVGGTDVVTANAWNTVAMGSGTKTISDGDKIAVVFETISNAFISDIFTVRVANGLCYPLGFDDVLSPHGTQNGVTHYNFPPVMLKFNDGTYGWIRGFPPAFQCSTGAVGPITTFAGINTSSSPDEMGFIFSLPFRATVCGHWIFPGQYTSGGSTFETSVLTDPSGTPTLITGTLVSWISNQIQQGSDFNGLFSLLPTPFTAEPGVEYVVSWRPTSAVTQTMAYFELGTGFEFLKRALPFSTYRVGFRTNQSGAFTESSTSRMPVMGLMFSHLETEPSGVLVHPGMTGRMQDMVGGLRA